LKNERILLVDTEGPARAVFQKALEDKGYAVSTASDGVQALQMLEDDRFGLVISEIEMARMSGIELLEEISRRRIAVPVIFLTDDTYWESYLELMNMEAFEYVTKSTGEQEILSVIQRIPHLSAA
jgi:DNA-binding NtrC family response regulator